MKNAATWAGLLGLHCIATLAQAQEFEVWPVARAEVDKAPDGRVFTHVWFHSINDSGQIAFAALTSLVVSGLFVFDRGEMLHIAGHGDPAPGGGDFGLFGYVSLNEQGHLAFSANLMSGEQGVFVLADGIMSAIARSGDAPTRCGPFRALVVPLLNNSEEIAFTGQVPAGYGIFFFDGTEIAAVACPGDPAPGGGTFVRATYSSLNNEGQLVFEALLSSPPNSSGIFLYERGKLSVVARTGDPGPENRTFITVQRPIINNAGQIAFMAGGIGLVLFETGQFRRLLPYTDPETGEVFTVGERITPDGFYLNDSGQIAFEGARIAQGEIFRGMFFFDGTAFRPIRYVGDLMPDPRGVRFYNFFSLKLNNCGEVSFVSDGYPRHGETSLFLAVPASH